MAAASILFAVYLALVGMGVGLTTGGIFPLEFGYAKVSFVFSALCLVGAYLLFLRAYLAKSAAPLLPLIALGGLTAVFSVGGTFGAWRWVNSREAMAASLPSLDNTISFKCDTSYLPPKRRHDQKIFMMQIYIMASSDSPNSLMVAQGFGTIPEGDTAEEWRGIHPEQFYRCYFTNYGTNSVANIVANFRADVFNESGIVLQTHLDMPPLALDIAPRNVSDFYIWNVSQYTVKVSLPDAIEGIRPGGKDKETIKLLPYNEPLSQTIFFDPYSKYPTPTPPK